MLRLDSSEMLPGSQKGEEKAGILKVETGNDHVTAARCNRRASRENGESQQVTYPDGKLI